MPGYDTTVLLSDGSRRCFWSREKSPSAAARMAEAECPGAIRIDVCPERQPGRVVYSRRPGGRS